MKTIKQNTNLTKASLLLIFLLSLTACGSGKKSDEPENKAPEITSNPATTVNFGTTYRYDLEAVDSNSDDVLTYELTAAPTGMSIDAKSGLISWTPTLEQVGEQFVSVSVSDDSALPAATQEFTVSVLVVNEAPNIISTPVTMGQVNIAYRYDAEAADNNTGDVLTYTLTTAPAGMVIELATGQINWTPTAAQVGEQNVIVSVSDNGNPVFSDTQDFKINVSPANVAPTIDSTPVLVGQVAVAYDYDVEATDPNSGDTLSYELTTAPAGMTINENTGLISWTPTAAQVGEHNVTVSVSDNGNPILPDTQDFKISVSPANVAPTINSTPVLVGQAAVAYSYDVEATDSNSSDTLKYILTTAPAGMTIEENTGLISWTPTAAQVGEHNVTVSVSDNGNPILSDTQDLKISVSPANVAPTINSTPVLVGQAAVAYSYDVEATDPNSGDTLKYILTTAPAGMTIEENTGLISWTPTAEEVGEQNVTVSVSDNGKPVLTADQDFIITVSSAVSGILSGEAGNAPAMVSLSNRGTADWVHWGLMSETDVNRKSFVLAQIGDVELIDGAELSRGINNQTKYFWVDGLPTVTGSDVESGLRAYLPGKGFEFTVPADTNNRTLNVFLGAKDVSGLFEASLSDGSAPDYTVAIEQLSGTISRMITLDFKAATAGQILTVRYVLNSQSGTTGWISLEAAALQGQPAVLSLPYSNDFSSGNVSDWISLDDTDTASNWRVNNGEYQQDAFVGFHDSAMQNGYHLGTYSVLSSATELNDYQFSVKATPLAGSGQDIGVMVRVDPTTDSYTRLSFSAANGFGRLESKVADIFTTLAKNARGYQPGTPLNITMQVQGAIIVAHVNGEKLFGAYDANPGSGTIGLYCRDQCAFDDVVLDNNASAPSIVIAEPTSYSVSASTTFNVGAVVLNTPAGGSVEFQLDGQAAACTSASDLGHANFFTAECSASSQGTYQLTAVLENQEGVELDSDTNQDVSVGDNYIAIGDSLSIGLDDNTASDGSSQNGWLKSSMGYAAILMDHLAAVPSQQPTIIHKAATPGDKTSDTLNQRIGSILERHLDANKAIVILGVNDANGTLFTPSGLGCSGAACSGTYKGNLQALINQLDAAGKSAIVALSPPRFGDPFSAPYTDDPAVHPRNLLIQDEYNVVIATELGLSNDQVGPDFYDYFLGSENRFYLYATNLHPNALGYAVMAHLLRNTITGDTSLPFVANNLCVRLTQAGSCESPLSYKENLLEVGNRYYIDQTYTLLQAIPTALNDGRWIMTKDLDRDLANTDYLSFDVPETSTLYVAYAVNATTIPVWLENNFVDTGINLNTDNPAARVMRLYSQNNVIGEVELPAADAATNGAAANYIVIVVKN